MAYKYILNKILVFAIIILLIGIGFIPSINGSLGKRTRLKTLLTLEPDSSEKKLEKKNTEEIRTCFYRHGNCEKTISITLNQKEKEELIKNLEDVLKSEMTLYQKFENFLLILKNYNILSENINLSAFFDAKMLDGSFEVVNNTGFMAHFAPIIILGGGFGFGIGEPYKPFNIFLHFLAVVGGLAWVYCLDPIEGVLYKLQSFLLPIFIGYISAYNGLIIFAVKPGLFYSNILAIGFTPFTAWLLFPPLEPEK